jgi:hypothetical protein
MTYYHGTLSRRAVDALIAGDGLSPQRPPGKGKYAHAVTGLSYLTPCFLAAADYAMSDGRDDWPSWHDFPEARLSHIFAFDLNGVGQAVPEEDELGWAVMHSMQRAAGIGNCESKLNLLFVEGLSAAPDLMADLADEARLKLGGMAQFRPLIEDPARWTPRAQTSAGRRLAPSISPRLGQALIDAGISLGITASATACAAWSFDRRKLRGLMDDPAKADEVAGAWSSRTAAVGCHG